ncbi:hypothetical protein COL30_11945 [Bacillus pseudomycoides]|uniref:Uncharacterized protein n=1 Tax=Bacillus pseudomycoides TaxID=64104 RepID=A0A2A8CAL9_9BACI|nr:hypothetical protein [Bacillus pseudomycoides]PEJ72495.1 hypothetical protein CN680_21705 [Bacillus pseudomycoides]PEM73246.1 hypothetical protein CN613_01955 [Bacillus pseudomycoides]PEP61161.1 hypothetical protein CN591_18420 [Bacillus pseudomycoides]PFW67985.1 hypothetical protein COL25_13825 [Bacillus pseudomycoides]PFW79996.1 hypothetical protein COL30_11945 [Bacillus pseudomycoides]
MAKNKLTIKVDADTTEALKQMKEVTEAANECVAALEKLETVMNRITGKSKPIKYFPKVGIELCGEVKPSDIIQRINNTEEKIWI